MEIAIIFFLDLPSLELPCFLFSHRQDHQTLPFKHEGGIKWWALSFCWWGTHQPRFLCHWIQTCLNYTWQEISVLPAPVWFSSASLLLQHKLYGWKYFMVLGLRYILHMSNMIWLLNAAHGLIWYVFVAKTSWWHWMTSSVKKSGF